MDADDISLPQRFEKQVIFMDTHPEVGICGSWIQLFGNNENRVIQYPSDPKTIHAKMFFENPFPHPGVILRGSVFRSNADLRYKVDYPHAEDYDLFSRCAKVTGVANIPEVLLLYRIHENQVSQAQHDISLSSQRKVRNRLLRTLIFPSQDQIQLDEHICMGWEKKPDKRQIKDAENFLVLLNNINQQKCVYPNPEFSKEIGEVWMRMISLVEPEENIFWKILRSPFRNYLPLSEAQKRKYFYRSIYTYFNQLKKYIYDAINGIPVGKRFIRWRINQKLESHK
jgi:hypothetical protein